MGPEDQDADAEFAAAFNEEDGAPTIADETPPDDGGGEAVETAGGDAGQDGGGQPPADGVAVVLNTEAQPPADDAALDPEKERQRLKSWEGRLRAQEAELKAKAKPAAGGGEEGEASEALESVADAAQARGSTQLAEAANAAAEAVESGEMSPEEAMAQLSEDFGEEFIKMIKAIVVATTKKEVEPVTKTVDEVVSSMNNNEMRAHFQAIASKHPDFSEIGQAESFKSFIAGLPDDVRGDAEQVAKGGSAADVIALLDAFKESQRSAQAKGPAAADTPSAEAPAAEELEGVRSGGVRLPERPAPGEDDYAGAWEHF